LVHRVCRLLANPKHFEDSPPWDVLLPTITSNIILRLATVEPFAVVFCLTAARVTCHKTL